MTLTIITINHNNASGLEKTLQSTAAQTCAEFEHIIIDGASTDGSTDVVRRYAESLGDRVKWVSEPDKGIYDAMNKGIGMASGEYVQFLNSGDCLASDDVTSRMYDALEKGGRPGILYGNLIKAMPDGSRKRDKGPEGKDMGFFDFFLGTINHSSAYIRRSLFDKYGLYDVNLRIASDWKWFMQAILYGKEKPVYTDLDVVLFDMTGLSESNKELSSSERDKVLDGLIPAPVLDELRKWSPSIRMMRRIDRYPWARKMVWFLERCLFKYEKHKK